MSSFVAFILVLVVTALVLFALARYTSSRTKKGNEPVSVDSTITKHLKRKNWILPIIIALIIAIKTVAGGLFFIAIVWLMRLDPKPYSKSLPLPSDADKKTAKRIYTWLLLSPFITVPVFLFSVAVLYNSSSTNELVLTALIPLIFHTILFLGFNSKSSFVYRHTQQAIFLVALRTGMAALAVNIGSYPEDGLGVFLLGNGFLWLFGTLWGRNQVVRGECWWAKRKGEAIIRTAEQLEKLSPQENIEHSTQLMSKNQDDAAVRHALIAFRFGDPVIKKQAVEILDELGEVEMF